MDGGVSTGILVWFWALVFVFHGDETTSWEISSIFCQDVSCMAQQRSTRGAKKERYRIFSDASVSWHQNGCCFQFLCFPISILFKGGTVLGKLSIMEFQKKISSDAGLVECTRENYYLSVHPWKLTCPLKRDYFSREYIFQPLIFRGHVSFQFWVGVRFMHRPGHLLKEWIHLIFCLHSPPALKWIFFAQYHFNFGDPFPKQRFFSNAHGFQNGWFLSLFPISGWCQTNVKQVKMLMFAKSDVFIVCNYFVHYRYLYTCWLIYTSIITLDQYPYVGWFFICFGLCMTL